jgi:hypothetical protein
MILLFPCLVVVWAALVAASVISPETLPLAHQVPVRHYATAGSLTASMLFRGGRLLTQL